MTSTFFIISPEKCSVQNSASNNHFAAIKLMMTSNIYCNVTHAQIRNAMQAPVLAQKAIFPANIYRSKLGEAVIL